MCGTEVLSISTFEQDCTSSENLLEMVQRTWLTESVRNMWNSHVWRKTPALFTFPPANSQGCIIFSSVICSLGGTLLCSPVFKDNDLVLASVVMYWMNLTTSQLSMMFMSLESLSLNHFMVWDVYGESRPSCHTVAWYFGVSTAPYDAVNIRCHVAILQRPERIMT